RHRNPRSSQENVRPHYRSRDRPHSRCARASIWAVARGWARPRRSGCAFIRSPAVTRPTMWAYVGNASTGPPFPWGLVSALSGYPQDPRSAGIDIDPHHLSFLDELEAIGVRGRIVFEVQVIVALHLRDDAPFDLAHGQVTPGPHLFPRTRLV